VLSSALPSSISSALSSALPSSVSSALPSTPFSTVTTLYQHCYVHRLLNPLYATNSAMQGRSFPSGTCLYHN
jgi:hypothetical protein